MNVKILKRPEIANKNITVFIANLYWKNRIAYLFFVMLDMISWPTSSSKAENIHKSKITIDK